MNNLQTNRLNFSKMVNRHFGHYIGEQYPDIAPRYPKSNNQGNGDNTKDIDRANIQSKINSIVAYVHNQLKDQKPSNNSKSVTKPTNVKRMKAKESVKPGNSSQTKLAATIPDPASDNQAETRNVIIYNVAHQQKTVIIDNPANRKVSIARIKALCSHKEKKCQHHSIPPPSDTNNYVNLKRFDEAKRQNAAFESMLLDQKQLQQDRQSIAQEIYTMRGYLDNIRGRLDSSLKKLVDSKTYSECNAGKNGKNEKTKTTKSKPQKQSTKSVKKLN